MDDGEERRNLANNILEKHLYDDSMEPVNVDVRSIQKIQDATDATYPPDKQLFMDTQNRIYMLMKTDTFPRFLKSDIYTRLSSIEIKATKLLT